MTIRNLQRYVDINYTTSGTSVKYGYVGNKYTFSTEPHIEGGPMSILMSSIYVDSVGSSGYNVKKKIRIPWKPKKLRPHREPKPPYLTLPRLPSYPVRRPNQSNRSWNKVCNNFDLLYQKILAKRVARLAQYKVRYAIYNKRMISYQKFIEKLNNGIVVERWKRGPAVKVMPYNYYYRATMQLYPAGGDKIIHERGYYDNSGDIRTAVASYCETGIPIAATSSAWTDDPLPYVDALQSALSSAESRAIAKIYDKINEQEVHLAQVVAERHQTYGLLADIAKRLAWAVTKFKFKTLIEGISPKQVANDTLAFMFGVRPLLDDAYGAGVQLAKMLSGPKDLIVARARQIGADSVTKSWTTVSDGGTDNVVYTLRTRITVKVSYHLEWSVSDAGASTLQQLGLINPAEVAWELMPWSFVVDWFLPIGNWIQSLTSDVGLTFLRGTRVQTIRTERELTIEYKGIDRIGPEYQRFWRTGTKVARKVDEIKERTVLTSPPKTRLPSFKSPISMYHLIEAMALLVQVASGNPVRRH